MNKKLSVVVLAMSIAVAGLAWGSAVQRATGKNEAPVITAQGSRPQPPLPPVSER